MDTMSMPETQRNLSKRFKEFIGIHDLYAEEKMKATKKRWFYTMNARLKLKHPVIRLCLHCDLLLQKTLWITEPISILM